MFARAMDPAALDALGFQRDVTVCAALEAPSADAVDSAKVALARLNDDLGEFDIELRALSGCACVEAMRQDVEHLFPSCQRRVRRDDCRPEPKLEAKVAAIAKEVRAAIAGVGLPKHHWRMFGRADRPDRFATRFFDIVGMYEGGSELFVPGQTPTGDRGDALVAALLEQPGVKAVVRQDAGLAVLVVREHASHLVFDHFAYDSVSGRFGTLVSELDDLHIDWHLDALALGIGDPEFHFDLRDGPFLGVYREPLERVDEVVQGGSLLVDRRYDRARERHAHPPVFVDRVEVSLPRGEADETLSAWVHLTAAGVEAIEAVGDGQLAVSFDDLPIDPTPPSFEPAVPLPFVARGQPTQSVLFDGLHGVFSVLHAVERANPGALVGNLDVFEITFPSGPLPGELSTRPGAERLRERLSKRPHQLTVRRAGAAFELELAPVR